VNDSDEVKNGHGERDDTMRGAAALKMLWSRHAVVSMVLFVTMMMASFAGSPTVIESSTSDEGTPLSENGEKVQTELILIPSEEDGGSQDHLGALGIATPIDESQPVQSRVDDIVAQGGIAIVNHPRLFSSLTTQDMARLRGYSGIEIYNGFAATEFQGRGDAVDLFDAVNSSLTEADMGLLWGFAVDDAHGVEDLGKGYIVTKASHSDADSIVASLRNGSFYSSTGATIEAVRVVARKEIIVTASEESTITFIAKGGTIMHRTDQPSSSASYHVQGDEGYVRVEVDNPSGKAWTQPMEVGSTGVTNNPYASRGRWLKGSIHCHTTESDGHCTPREVVDWHKQNGYSFLAITDHNKITMPS